MDRSIAEKTFAPSYPSFLPPMSLRLSCHFDHHCSYCLSFLENTIVSIVNIIIIIASAASS